MFRVKKIYPRIVNHTSWNLDVGIIIVHFVIIDNAEIAIYAPRALQR
jgi:hypothetical protein